MLGLPQFFTGPLVNAFLLLAALLNGMWSGVIIGLFTPGIAFIRGILAPPLGPMIPFIMAGNAILVIVFSLIAGKRGNLVREIIGVILGSFLKYLLLSQAVTWIVQLPPPVAKAMQTPQLFTALGGGAIALIVYRLIPARFRL
ncbi:MAG: ECF transporter S component [Candidatus Atribacteria bacterium]|nr:ECF transporter S component [Candidatus Atribacteria bacterium]